MANNDKIESNLDVMMIAKYLFYNTNDMSNLKLQKLLFFAYKDYYQKNKLELFDDNFQAWIYGPVLPNVYKNFYKILGDNDFEKVNDYFNSRKKVKIFLDEISQKYGNLDVFELVKKTHKEKSWINARKDLGPFESSTNIMNIKATIKFK